MIVYCIAIQDNDRTDKDDDEDEEEDEDEDEDEALASAVEEDWQNIYEVCMYLCIYIPT